MTTIKDCLTMLSTAIREEKAGIAKRLAELDTLERLTGGGASKTINLKPGRTIAKLALEGGNADRFLAAVKANPGLSGAEVCKIAGIKADRVVMTKIRKELGSKLKLQGVKRATRYFAK